MYFITNKNSETGKKFQEVMEQNEIAFNAQKEMSIKYGFHSWRGSYKSVWGGIGSCEFKETPNSKIWGKGMVDGEFYPKKNSKIGKAICDEFEKLPFVSNSKLNSCVGFKSVFSCIGFNGKNDEFFGFILREKWNVTVPEDCEEVTSKKYHEIFKTSQSQN